MTPGQKIRFHGGWDGAIERCSICKFQCSYIDSGVIVERYQVWDIPSHTSIPSPDELWVARLDNTGGFVVGYLEQFEVDTPSLS